MSDPRGFRPINQLWSGAGSTDADSECLYEEISGPASNEDSGSSFHTHQRVRRSRKLEHNRPTRRSDILPEPHHHHHHHHTTPTRHRAQRSVCQCYNKSSNKKPRKESIKNINQSRSVPL